MSDLPRAFSASVHVDAAPEAVYDLVADQTRAAEWSPQVTACEWEDPARAGQVGARFTGHNEVPGRTWSTTSEVVVADRPEEFAWEVGPGLVRWTFEVAAAGAGSRLTERWEFLDRGIELFREKFEDPEAQIEDRTRGALDGIPRSLAAVKQILERP